MFPTKNIKSEQQFSTEKMAKVNLFETENMFTDIYCLEPGQEQKVHAHQGADKIYFVVEGRARFHIGGEEQELGENQVVFAASDSPHGVGNHSNARVVLLVFMAPNPNKK